MRVSEHIIDHLVRPVMLEIRAVATAAGVHLSGELIEQIIVVDPFEAFFLPSMGQDMANGNLIEFENVVGEPLREAERLNVPTPTLRTMYALLRGLQWQTMERRKLVHVPSRSNRRLKYG